MTAPSDQEPDLAADAALIDRVYLSPDDGSDAAELGELRLVRGLVARVRDEMPGVDPPQAISARLLQAAAAAAPAAVSAVEPERPGLWARLKTWVGGVAMHPGMAAVATLVVVAGAAAIWARQGGKVAEPTMSSEDQREEPAVARPDHATMQDRPQAPAGEPVTAPVTPPVDEITDDRPPRKKKGVAPAPDKPTVVEESRDKGGEVANEKGRGKGSGSAGGEGAGPTPTVTTKVGDKPDKKPEPTPDSEPPAPPPDPTSTIGSDDNESPPQQQELSASEQARALTEQAIKAARRQDCDAVKLAAKKVSKLDSAYYRNTFVKQADIKKCL